MSLKSNTDVTMSGPCSASTARILWMTSEDCLIIQLAVVANPKCCDILCHISEYTSLQRFSGLTIARAMLASCVPAVLQMGLAAIGHLWLLE